MTGTEIAVRQAVQLDRHQLEEIARTEFVPPGLRGNVPAILACVATGRELGIGDMAALKSIHIIDGKATFSAELMVQLVRRAGHSITGEVTDGKATVTGTRRDTGDVMTSTWTTAMAERAGLLGKSNWKKYPEAMLWARAASQLCRMLFADCFAGATYTPEELEDSAGEPRLDERRPAGTPESGDAVTSSSPAEPSITAAQKRKANVLIGNLRDELRITTAEVYLAAGHPVPELAEGEMLHWSPLRDSLTKKEASLLIDRLERYASSGELSPPSEWAAGSSTSVSADTSSLGDPGDNGKAEALVEQLADELLTVADALGKRAEAEDAIAHQRESASNEELVGWLRGQIDRAHAKAAA